MYIRKRTGILALVLIIFLGIAVFSVLRYQAKAEGREIKIAVDSDTRTMPENFRVEGSGAKAADEINLNGIDKLNAAGSSQFTEDGLRAVRERLKYNGNIEIVDLRQESHGFINGIAVCWTNDNNKPNKGLTRDKVIEDEEKRLKSIELNKDITFGGNRIIPVKVQTEEKLASEMGMKYIRIPVTDREKPTDDIADYFIKSVNVLPKGTCLYFHCKEGLGRTTLFMIMYDSMRNAKEVSLEDIVKRQAAFGGQNLLENTKTDTSKERAEFIREFYSYAKNNNDAYRTTWSQWKSAHK